MSCTPIPRTVRRWRLARGAAPVAGLALAGLLAACGGGTSTAAGSSGATEQSGTATQGGAASPSGASAAAASSPATTQATTKATTQATPRCHTKDLRLTLFRSRLAGAAESMAALALDLQNVSGHACTFNGFPGMALVDAAGHRLPTKLERTGDPAEGIHLQKKLVVVGAGQSGHTYVSWENEPPGDPNPAIKCDKRAVALAVTPPDETTQLTVNFAFGQTCNGYMVTGPLAAGRA